jgi:hypothetical protein
VLWAAALPDAVLDDEDRSAEDAITRAVDEALRRR